MGIGMGRDGQIGDGYGYGPRGPIMGMGIGMGRASPLSFCEVDLDLLLA